MKNFKPFPTAKAADEQLHLIGDIDTDHNHSCKEIRAEKTNALQSKIALSGIDLKSGWPDALKKAEESYTLLEFLLDPINTVFDILTSFGLEEEGYLKKADQQRTLRPLFILVLLFLVGIAMFA